MADERTQVTELGTAAGMVLGDDHADLTLLDVVDIPGIPSDVWRSPLEAAAEDWHRYHSILRASLANGAAFRASVLRGRDPERVDWRGGSKAMWVSDAPVDLRVNDVYLVSAKYDSVCLLNRAPASVFDDLLVARRSGRARNWYAEVAEAAYVALYESLIDALVTDGVATGDEFPRRPEEMTRDHRVHLKYLMKSWTRSIPESARPAYEALCRKASDATAERWQRSLTAATETTKLGMLAQMLRICGGVYWLLGQHGERPVRCKVADTTTWRTTYRLRSFTVSAPTTAGQPRVDWTAVLEPRPGASADAASGVIEGMCEIRWSHGKFQGNPECKVQLRTPVWELPGYEAFAHS